MGDVLQVTNVSVRRGGRNIVDGVNWSVNEGERWVILGPNGAGKTTLIQLVAGRMHPTYGNVEILGSEVGKVDLAELRPLVGVASSAIDSRISNQERVLDVVRTAAYGITETWREEYEDQDNARALILLTALGVGELADRKYGTISSGERKRVGIARALMPNPEVLILDEPAAGLDLGGRERLLKDLTKLAAGQFAPVMILVTHHVEEIPAGFTHALVMEGGKIAAEGPIESVITSQNLTAAFDTPVSVETRAGRFSARADI